LRHKSILIKNKNGLKLIVKGHFAVILVENINIHKILKFEEKYGIILTDIYKNVTI